MIKLYKFEIDIGIWTLGWNKNRITLIGNYVFGDLIRLLENT